MMMTQPRTLQDAELLQSEPNLVPLAESLRRYHYLTGASGERYLFTVVTKAEILDYSGAVIVVLSGSTEVPRWVGALDNSVADVDPILAEDTVEAGSAINAPDDRRLKNEAASLSQIVQSSDQILVHLLAGTASTRADIIDDIRRASMRSI